MSSTSGSLVGYENNNDIKKMKRPSVEISKAGSCIKKKAKCVSVHLNNLWSLWYGVFGTLLQAYTAVKCIKRILGYSVLTWPETTPLPILEMNTSLGLTGAAVLLLPFFLASAVFKIGNLANDGFKLGRQLSTCSRESPKDTLDSGGGCGVWKHGGPTAPFLHLVIAFCLLLPKLLMEARLIEAGLLPQESIWRTDLDFMVVHRDRLVVLSFMTSTNSTFNHKTPTPLPILNADDGNISLPESTPAALAFTHTVVKTLREYIGHEDHHQNLQNSVEAGWGSSVSVEYLNFALSLLVYSVRYPALFWATNKCMGLLFSFQLLINGLQTLLAYAGMSVLYKVQIIGAWKALPLLKHQPRGVSPLNGETPFLLNPQVTLALYILSLLLVLSSSLVLYLYGHTRFNSFLNQERERKVITLKEGGSSKWGYFTHCAALCVLVSVGICNAPLLHDYTIVYKGSLDGAILACVIGGILHLFLWVVVWLFLTIKQKWIFKLRVSVGRATVRQARSVKLVTEIDLMTCNPDDPSAQPLLVVGNGRTYTVNDISPKKAIMGVIQKTTMIKKVKSENGSTTNDENDEEQIYWLRPALVTPQASPDGSKQLCWFNKKPKHKVTFNETSSTSNARNKGNSTRRRLPGMEVDDGDYATLRELPLPPPITDGNITDDNISEEGKLLACVHDEHVTYASTSQDLVPPVDYEDPSPLLTPEPLDKIGDHQQIIHHQTPISVIVHNHNQAIPTGLTPRCLRRADSGMPHEELTPRSDSISTESSSSPPDPPGSNHSETSSGIHSNESSEHPPQFNSTQQPPQILHQSHQPSQQTRRATSVADLQQPTKDEIQWKSCSLQRNVAPPTSASFIQSPHFASSPSSNSVYSGYCNQNYVNTAELDHNVILENPNDETVVIRRKIARPKTVDITQTPVIKEEPYGRATNVRMTSFTDDLKNITASSATLPHYPTQPVPEPNIYPQCNTMPLPQHTSNNIPVNLSSGNSCNVYPRQHTTLSTHHANATPHTTIPNHHTTIPSHIVANHHTTLPTHHNGVRLFNASSNPYIKRLQCQNGPIRYNSINEPIYTGVNRQTGEIYHYNS